ncbi:MAG: R-phenyllactate dehydratase beta subunit [Actinobacteria bacterium ADurb.Bin346]|nr:MAG: R-phenyllactate dehydratase beta subunit [Actinobacteria bacterium ADurb.Bin346]
MDYRIDDNLKETEIKKEKIGWLCTYAPEEIIIAAGYHPLRITGKLKAFKSEGYFPINFCPFIKASMEDLLASALKLKGVIFTNSCDGMRRFYDSCRAYLPDLPAFMLDVPRNKNIISIEHFTASLKEMIIFLEELSGKKICSHELESAIGICNEKRMLLKKLSNHFRNNQGSIGVKNYYKILEKSMTDEPEAFIKYIKERIKELRSHLNSASAGPAIMVIGNFINEERLWDIFDEIDCIIASEDMCNSSRYFENIKLSAGAEEVLDAALGAGKESPMAKLLTGIAVRQLYKPQCMRTADMGTKIEEIIKSITRNNIKGLIFISQKFCDNTLLLYPLLREKLAETGIPSLFLEIEHNNISAGQIKTRLQAFLEII